MAREYVACNLVFVSINRDTPDEGMGTLLRPASNRGEDRLGSGICGLALGPERHTGAGDSFGR
jgi:hypothetical protein